MNIRLIIVTGLAVWIALCGTPGTARGEQLFASVNGTTQNGGGSIVQYAPDGTPTTFASGLSRPRGLVFDSAGNLFVATNTSDNSGNFQGTIFKFTPDGVMSTFATGFSPVNFFLQGLVMDSAGNIFVAAGNQVDPNSPTTIYKVTPGGTVSTFGSVPGDSRGLAFDSSGNLYAPDGAFNTIYKFTPGGVQSIFVASPPFSSTGVVWVAFDSFGNLFGSIENPPYDDATSLILKFTPDGTASEFATGLANPRGLAFDSAGNLFVADIPGSRTGNILEFTPGGTQTTFASLIGRLQGNGGPEYLAFTARAVTPVGSNVPVNIGAVGSAVVALTFPQVTVAGTTTVTPIDPSLAGTLPSGYELTGSNLAFQITTTATYITPPPIIIAFQVPSVDAATFSQLRVLHNEGGTLVDRTASEPAPNPTTQTIYASVNSLSPFIIVKRTAPQLTALGPAQVWIGLKNSDDVGTKFDLLAEALKNGTVIGSGQVNSVSGGSSGFNNAIQDAINMSLSSPTAFNPGDTLSFRLSVRIAATGHRSGTARLWFNDAAANSRFGATINTQTSSYFLRSGFALGPAVGSGPKNTIDVLVDRAVGGNPFKPFGTWNKSF